jgi:hypothetical protein
MAVSLGMIKSVKTIDISVTTQKVSECFSFYENCRLNQFF